MQHHLPLGDLVHTHLTCNTSCFPADTGQNNTSDLGKKCSSQSSADINPNDSDTFNYLLLTISCTILQQGLEMSLRKCYPQHLNQTLFQFFSTTLFLLCLPNYCHQCAIFFLLEIKYWHFWSEILKWCICLLMILLMLTELKTAELC